MQTHSTNKLPLVIFPSLSPLFSALSPLLSIYLSLSLSFLSLSFSFLPLLSVFPTLCRLCTCTFTPFLSLLPLPSFPFHYHSPLCTSPSSPTPAAIRCFSFSFLLFCCPTNFVRFESAQQKRRKKILLMDFFRYFKQIALVPLSLSPPPPLSVFLFRRCCCYFSATHRRSRVGRIPGP